MEFGGDRSYFSLCPGCYENYRHALVEEDHDHDGNFCTFCECFVPDTRWAGDRCRLCSDRIWAELQAEDEENEDYENDQEDPLEPIMPEAEKDADDPK